MSGINIHVCLQSHAQLSSKIMKQSHFATASLLWHQHMQCRFFGTTHQQISPAKQIKSKHSHPHTQTWSSMFANSIQHSTFHNTKSESRSLLHMWYLRSKSQDTSRPSSKSALRSLATAACKLSNVSSSPMQVYLSPGKRLQSRRLLNECPDQASIGWKLVTSTALLILPRPSRRGTWTAASKVISLDGGRFHDEAWPFWTTPRKILTHSTIVHLEAGHCIALMHSFSQKWPATSYSAKGQAMEWRPQHHETCMESWLRW